MTNQSFQLLHKTDHGTLCVCSNNGILEVFCTICQSRWSLSSPFEIKYDPEEFIEFKGTETKITGPIPPH